MSNLSELLPSGAGQNQVEFVASGTLPNGKPVILKADGTVEVVSAPNGAQIPLNHSPANYNTNYNGYFSIDVDPNDSNKIVIAYANSANSLYGTAVVGVITGTSIAFGTPTVFHSGSSMLYASGVGFINTPNKVIIAWGSTGLMQAAVGTISGNSISFGSSAVVGSSYRIAHDGCVLTGTDKYVACYRHNSSNDARAHVLTASGTSISVGGSSTVSSGYPLSLNVTSNHDGTKCFFSYREAGSSSYGHCKIASISGTSLTYGTTTTWLSSSSAENEGTFMDNGSVIILFKDYSNSNFATVKVGTVSGTSITLGSGVVISNTYADGSISIENSGPNFAVMYRGSGSSIIGASSGSFMKVRTGTISGTVPTLSSEYDMGDFKSDNGRSRVIFRNNDNDMLFMGTTGPTHTPQYQPSVWFGSLSTPITTLTATNLIGISAADAADTATAKINVWGGINSSVVPPAGALTTYAITVANASGNKYFIDTVQQDTPALTEGNTYKFDQSDSTNSGHPLRFSTTANGSHGGGSVYSSGVTVVGTPGNAGSYTQIVVPTDAPTLYYYCTAHSGMGGSATTPAAAALIIGSDYYVHTDGSINTTTTGGQKIGTAISTTTINMKDLT